MGVSWGTPSLEVLVRICLLFQISIQNAFESKLLIDILHEAVDYSDLHISITGRGILENACTLCCRMQPKYGMTPKVFFCI